MKKTKPLIIIVLLSIVLAVIVGTLLLTFVYSIPVDRMVDNIRSSAYTIQNEGVYPQVVKYTTSYLDNYSDALMLNTAGYDGYYTPIVEALKNHRYCYSYQLPDKELVNYYLSDVACDFVDSYCRYWHGYLVILKLLLLFTDLTGIRIINIILQSLLIVILLILFYKNDLKHLIIPFIISYLQIMPLAIAMCIQFSQCAYILLLGSILVIVLYIKKYQFNSYLVLFLYLGIATAYFTVLSYPLVTYGIPIVIFISIFNKQESKQLLIQSVKLGFMWIIGYAFMWLGKWVTCTLITGENIFNDVFSSASNWVNAADYFEMIYNNFRDFLYTPVSILSVTYFVVLIVLIFKKLRALKTSTWRQMIFSFLPYLLIAMSPIVWYSALKTHSSVHHFFTNKILMISMFSGLSFFSLVNNNLDLVDNTPNTLPIHHLQ